MLRQKESPLNEHEADYGFKGQVDAITSQILSPENIDTYADAALTNLVHVVGQILEEYKKQPTILGQSVVESEHSALNYFGLDQGTIEATLDHIAGLADEIRWLDQYISDVTKDSGTVITPTDHRTIEATSGSGSFEQKATIPRLKTILLLLTREYGVELTDPEQYRFIPGTVTNDMLRQTPYNVVDLPSMNRVIDVCDEEDNVTFVFDRDKLLTQVDIDSELVHMSKGQLKELLITNPNLGKVLKHSDEFSAKINALLENLDLDEAAVAPVRLLRMESESGEKLLSVNAVSILLFGKNTKRYAVNEAAQTLGDGLGEVYYVGSSPRFDTDQVGLIRQCLVEAGHLNEEKDVDEADLFTMNELAITLGDELGLGRKIDPGTIHKTIELLEDRIAANHKKGAGKKRTTAYTAEEKDVIKQALWERLYQYPAIPDDRISFSALSNHYNCVREIVERGAAEVLQPDEVHSYTLANNKIDQTVTAEQKQLIEAWLDREGYIWPEGYVSSTEAKTQLNTTNDTVKRLAQKLLERGELDSTDVRIRFNSKSGQLIRYSAHAMQVMEEALKANLRIQRAIARKLENTERPIETVVPADWLTNLGIAQSHDLNKEVVRNCANYLHERGEITRVRDDTYTGGESYYYPPDAAERIVSTITNKPPEDWHSENSIIKAVGRREHTSSVLSNHRHIAKEYWYMGQPMRFYPSSVLQEMTAEINEFPPEGWKTARMLRSHLGGSAKVWNRTIDYAHANNLVTGAEYRSRKGSAMFYSPAEQEILLEARKQTLQQTGRTELGKASLK